ncbi:hypothetical protein [Nocardioides sp.]|uniref:hypothetical protein n=1 Tax=Nocardioides sp. TaxID=35761 RepID=UPI0039E53038
MTRWLPLLWCAGLTVLLLGPALGPGYVIGHDLVWVPQLDLRPGFLGLGSGLPRAVPSDAVVAVLDDVVPAALLERLMLVGALLLAGTGAARLVGGGLVGRLAAVSAAVWSPFVVERLWLGHWPVLLAYAVLPWLVVATRARRLPAWTWGLLLVGSLSANAGLMTGLTLVVCGRGRRLRLLLAVAAANAPWLVAGLRHAALARDAGGYAAFALHGDGVPAPLAALSLAGIWNAEVVPGSREGVLAWLALAGLLVLAAAGLRPWWSAGRTPESVSVAPARPQAPGEQRRLAILWAVGYGLAVAGWAAPDALAWLGEHLPGAGVLRDSSRELALCLPAGVAVVAAGAERLAAGARAGAARAAVGVAVALFPVMVLSDASWGIGGVLDPVDYPAEWAQAGAVVRGHGDVLVLPLSAYRAPAWAGRRPVLDPLPRYLAPDAVSEDALVVDGHEIAGEDPRVRRVQAALAEPTPEERADALAREGIGWVVTERDVAAAPEVAGEPVHDGPLLSVVRLADPVRRDQSGVAVWLAWAAYLLLAVIAAATPVVTMITRRRSGATVPR